MNHHAKPFAPSGNGVTVQLVVGTKPGTVRYDNILPPAPAFPNVVNQPPIASRSQSVRIYNAGPDTAFIELVGGQSGGSDIAPSPLTGFPMPPNTERVFSSRGATVLAAVSVLKSTLYATPGEGGI